MLCDCLITWISDFSSLVPLTGGKKSFVNFSLLYESKKKKRSTVTRTCKPLLRQVVIILRLKVSAPVRAPPHFPRRQLPSVQEVAMPLSALVFGVMGIY